MKEMNGRSIEGRQETSLGREGKRESNGDGKEEKQRRWEGEGEE